MGLTTTTLLKMGIRISIVIIITAYVSYLHIVSNLEEQTLDKLEKYIIERSLKESSIFQLAEDNHKIFADNFLELWPNRKEVPSEKRFNKLFFSPGDGTYRLKKEVFDGIERDFTDPSNYRGISKSISGFVGRGTPIEDNSFRNRLLLSFDLVDRYAQGWSNRFANTYVSMPEGVNIVHWPGLPWALGADAALDIPAEEWVYIVNKENNPSRKSVWTGLYFDQTANEWMVSCETPVDDVDGKHLINIGHDILLNKLFDRVFNDHLEGAYNFIIRDDGRLIAHPKYLNELRDVNGVLNIKDINSKMLKEQYSSIMKAIKIQGDKAQIIDESESGHDSFIAVSKIKGPNWRFVTVYPKELLSSPATKAAKFIFFIGLIGLIIELIMLYLVLKSSVINPLNQFLSASKIVGGGNYKIKNNPNIQLPVERKDEVGVLAKTFLLMADRIEDYKQHLEERIEYEVKSNRKKDRQLFEKNKMVSMGEMIGNIAHQWRQPLSIISTSASGMKLKKELGTFSDQEADYYIEVIMKNTKYLSSTIDIFSNFIKEEKELKNVLIQDRIRILSSVIEGSLKEKHINLKIKLDSTPIYVEIVGNELDQVLMNLIHNALDVLVEQKTENPFIEIQLTQKDNTVKITIEDNGGGVPPDILPKIFDPYFTTKHQSQGTGLGLHMSKQIVLDSFKGELFVKNTDRGAKFCIKFETECKN